jgi:hypothetical protein
MTTVIIDGIEYVPKAEIPELTDDRLQKCLECLTEIQYFREQTHKHRAWAWDALNALSPELAKLAGDNAQAAFYRIHGDPDHDDE